MITLWLLLLLATLLFFTILVVLRLFLFISSAKCPKTAAMNNNKTIIVTGGNGGIGRETAKELAKRGARVILACRNLEKANQVKDEIINETKNRSVIVKHLDLSSQKSIRKFAEDIIRTEPRLDVLIHNAGIAAEKIRMSQDKIEMTMATNHFGPFLLTHLLIDLLKRSAPSRIVVVSSELYRLVSLNLDDLNPQSSWFPPLIYYRSKYANIYFTKELARRLEGTQVTANCLHPGLVQTDIWDSAPAVFRPFLRLLVRSFFKTTNQGCQTSVYVACSQDLDGVSGKYFSECKESGLSDGANDMNKAKKLWELSENFVKLTPEDPKI